MGIVTKLVEVGLVDDIHELRSEVLDAQPADDLVCVPPPQRELVPDPAHVFAVAGQP